MPRKPKPVASEVRVRLEKAATDVSDAKEAYELAVERRDQVVLEAVDLHGMAHGAVAKAIGVVQGRISAILAHSQPDAGGDE
ncbi:MAG: hypothetical protein M3Y04_02480 [Actinomycetota bacterium]|nr:hypothetical protein [Actinomycetota bacterium]